MSNFAAISAHRCELGEAQAYLDLAAFDANAAKLAQLGGGLPIRVATKSIRVPALIKRALAADPRFQGLMTFSGQETICLANRGFDDFLIAYPVIDAKILNELAALVKAGKRIVFTVDDIGHLNKLVQAAKTVTTQLEVSIEVDAAYRPFGLGRAHLGTRRSPLRSENQVLSLVDLCLERPELTLVGLMAYEGQVAGLGDDRPGKKFENQAVRLIQKQSLLELQNRVTNIVQTVNRRLITAGAAKLAFVNAGGTGSLSRISPLGYATELASGSGFFCPTLFDNYQGLDLQPAAFFALPVARIPAAGMVTVAGGGYIASGSAGTDRLPTPVWPAGLSLLAAEGAGEVQTPLAGADLGMKIGDTVIFRHSKAGEYCERFNQLFLYSQDGFKAVKTYRGLGWQFF